MSSGPAQFDREEREVEFARALAFSDGVFAIAITLLVLTIEVPDVRGPGQGDRLWHALDDLAPMFFSYFLSFAVIGLMWLNHHRLFARVRRLDGSVLWLNILSLAFVCLIPFTTQLMGRYGNESAAVTLYALNLALASLAYTFLWWYCVRRDLLGEDLTPAQLNLELWSRLAIAFGFLLSIPVAFLSTGLAEASWLLVSFGHDPVARRLVRRRGEPDH